MCPPPHPRALARPSGLVALWLLVAFALPALAQRLPIRTFTMVDGLAHDRVNHVLEDSLGFLWLSTQLGLSRWDGERFESFRHGPDEVWQVVETGNGEYWVASASGVYRFLPEGDRLPEEDVAEDAASSQFRRYPLGTALDDTAYAFVESSAGELFVGARTGLHRYRPGVDAFERVPLGDGDTRRAVYFLAEGRDGTLWLATRNGLHAYRDGDEHTELMEETLRWWVSEVMVDSRGRLWVASDAGLFVHPSSRLDEVRARHFDGDVAVCPADEAGGLVLPRGDAPCRVEIPGRGRATRATALAEGADGSVWVAVERRDLLRVLPGEDAYLLLSQRNGLPRSVIRGLRLDSRGSLWVATSVAGVARLAASGYQVYGELDGLDEPVQRLLDCGDGGLVSVASFRRLYRRSGRSFVPVRPRLPDEIATQQSPGSGNGLCDSTGSLWLVVPGGVVHYPPTGRLEDLESGPPPAFLRHRRELPGLVMRLEEDADGDVWIAYRIFDSPRLSRWNRSDGTLDTFDESDGLPEGSAVIGIGGDSAGSMWFGWLQGIGRIRTDELRGDVVELFGADDGLPPGQVLPLMVDSEDRLWARTTAGFGFFELPVESPDRSPVHGAREGIRFVPIPALAERYAIDLVEGSEGRIYVNTFQGLARLEARESGEEGAEGEVTFEVVTFEDAPPSGVSYALGREPDGSIWIASAAGLVRVPTDEERPVVPTPPARILEVAVDDEPLPLSALGAPIAGPYRLGWRQKNVRVRFTAPDLAVDRRLRFRHRLIGGGGGWSSAQESRVVRFANLAPGSYRFEVEPLAGEQAGATAAVAFTVVAPVWRRGWFLALVAGAVGALLFAWHRRRLARVLAIERVRTAIATDLHDDVGSGLARISVLSEVGRGQIGRSGGGAAQETLERIGASARQLMQAAGDIVWAVDPTRDDLGSLLVHLREFASDLLGGAGIDWTLSVEGASEKTLDGVPISAAERRHLWMILKEALHNVARHARASAVTIEVEVSPRRLRFRVRDDGTGFDSKAAAASRDDGDEGGLGLGSMARRAEAMGAELQVVSAPDEGTEIELVLPRTGRSRGVRARRERVTREREERR